MKIRNAARYQARNRRYRKPLWRLVGIRYDRPIRPPSKSRQYMFVWDTAAPKLPDSFSADFQAQVQLDPGACKVLADWLMNGFPSRG